MRSDTSLLVEDGKRKAVVTIRRASAVRHGRPEDHLFRPLVGVSVFFSHPPSPGLSTVRKPARWRATSRTRRRVAKHRRSGSTSMRCSPQCSEGGHCFYVPKRKAPPKSATGVSFLQWGATFSTPNNTTHERRGGFQRGVARGTLGAA